MNTGARRVRKDRFTPLLLVGAAMIAVVAIVYLAGREFGLLARWWLFSGALAFPGFVFAGMLAGSLILTFLALILRRNRKIALLGTGVVSTGLLVALLVTAFAMPATVTPDAVPARQDGQLRVLGWNVLQGAEDAASRAAVIGALQPDIVVLSELYQGNLLRDGDVPAGYVSYGVRGIAVTVLVADDLPRYRVVDADESGRTSGFVLAPEVDGAAPRIVAAHLVALSFRGDSSGRDFGLDWISSHCGSPDTIVAGDLNAVPANMPGRRLGSCRTVGAFAPSWPSMVPPLFGAAIDNVLATPEWDAARVATLDVAGIATDHRPIVADLVRR
ncbi:endonuclease/exonuclease/phosphatase family protein [Microbacterium sp. 77mftsu3.1]|uniref:endonuclease/exonuclease/phosphatase family protein n=1 Tax=Microbacterium sp. 77mftsu3.1 TaxID=1761802 RepID=UPI0003610BBC|nr:endonuclease/exonuclease/phosphatase family protein [Microbacterium sp. 77mftsu3.1]SDG82900.1 Metal-dependent hydrolase, endonuclease/exonuclease/phosphatase family [Microbacterium sp. 77mftsu3.1]